MTTCLWDDTGLMPCELQAIDCTNCEYQDAYPIDKLSDIDIKAIQNWIYSYADNHRYPGTLYRVRPLGSIEKILFEWNKRKKDYLFDIFKGELILEKPICYHRSKYELARMFADSFWDKPTIHFREELTRRVAALIDHVELDEAHHDSNTLKLFINHPDMYIHSLFQFENLVTNIYSVSFDMTLYFKNNTEYKIVHGIKTMRLLRKLSHMANMDAEFEIFRQKHSMYLNHKDLHGTLCISIHPLDYLTMSDNENGWSSCIAWRKDSEYKLGAVEMMNSAAVVCAYLKANTTQLEFLDSTWNSKKWRELFVINPDIIMEIKPYPYYNFELTTIVLEWLHQLTAEYGWHYTTGIVNYDTRYPLKTIDEQDSCQFTLVSHHMYNDFGMNTFGHLMYYNDYFIKNHNYYSFKYSGADTCVRCGQYFASDDTTHLECPECESSMFYCGDCECEVSEDEAYWDEEGIPYCHDCYAKVYCYDGLWGEIEPIADMINLIVYNTDGSIALDCQTSYKYIDFWITDGAEPAIQIDDTHYQININPLLQQRINEL